MQVSHLISQGKFILLGAVLLAIAGCGPRRQAQCQELGNTINQVMTEVDNLYQSQIGQASYDPDFERQLADVFESGAANIAAVDVSDDELSKLQDELVATYQDAAAGSRQAANIIPASGLLSPDQEQEVDQLKQSSGGDMPRLIAEMNLHCLP